MNRVIRIVFYNSAGEPIEYAALGRDQVGASHFEIPDGAVRITIFPNDWADRRD